jgi:hypothetical protein
MREEGYYWVKRASDDKWEVAFYEDRGWRSTNWTDCPDDEQLHLINETRLYEPKDVTNRIYDRRSLCTTCTALKRGVRFRITPPHTCGL